MSTVDKLLDRLQGVRRAGPGKWMAKCPAHNDKNPSLGIIEGDGGKVVCHCFAGCDTSDVLAAVGLNFSDLFPEKIPEPGQKAPRVPRFNASELLRTAIHESTLIVVAMSKMTGGSVLDDGDMARVTQAMETLDNIRREVLS